MATVEKTVKIKRCPGCGRELLASQFYKNSNTKDGLSSYCKECENERNRLSRARKRARERGEGITQQGIKATFKISDFDDNMLFAELRRRGFSGELRFSKVITV